MKIDFDHNSMWPTKFDWQVTGILWYPPHAVFGKKMKTICYGWFDSLESAIKWCERNGGSFSYPIQGRKDGTR